MAYKDFSPSQELAKFQQENGEDTYIKLNLLYIAFTLNELNGDSAGADFDDLCEDVLEISLDDAFDDFNLIDVAEGVSFIIQDSNYTLHEYDRTYKRDRERVCEELLAYLEKSREQIEE